MNDMSITVMCWHIIVALSKNIFAKYIYTGEIFE